LVQVILLMELIPCHRSFLKNAHCLGWLRTISLLAIVSPNLLQFFLPH
jgi:hypothetical protein